MKMASAIPFIDQLYISKGWTWCPATLQSNPTLITIIISISCEKGKPRLFKQRLIRVYPLAISHGGFAKRKNVREKTEEFEWEMEFEKIDEVLHVHIRHILGKRIQVAALFDFDDALTRGVVSTITRGKQFGQLYVHGMKQISKDTGHFLKTITTDEIGMFNLIAGEIEDDPVGFPTHFASLARSMVLQLVNKDGTGQNEQYVFGLLDANWEQIILDLFAQKIDKLSIDTCYEEYLSENEAKLLME
ncbi:hypothetical protein PMAYCL1PPCAC_08930, partial [Pristionchus mayeri]